MENAEGLTTQFLARCSTTFVGETACQKLHRWPKKADTPHDIVALGCNVDTAAAAGPLANEETV